MRIRKAALKDAKQIAQVLVSSYNLNSIEEGITVFNDEIKKNYHYLVSDEDSKIIGIVTWQMHGLPKHQLCELDRIAVLPEFRGKGIAERLFNALIEDANKEYKKFGYKLRKLYILTHADNERAQAFYKRMGCMHESTLKSHFYKDKDEFVFSMFFD